MADAYICYSSGITSPAFRQVINGPLPISNAKLTSSGASTVDSAAPAETVFAVVTLSGGGGFVNVGATAATTDRYLPEGIPSVVTMVAGETLAFINL